MAHFQRNLSVAAAGASSESYTVDDARKNEIETTKCYKETACSADTQSIYTITGCLWAGSTPSCSEVVIAESPTYGRMLFLDHEIQSSEHDEAIYHEHLVHLAMAAARSHSRILIVGGGEGATAREVLKYDRTVLHIDWVDIDRPLVDLCRRYLGYASDAVYNDSRLHYTAADIREFLAATHMRYDVIILDLPDPDLEDVKNPAALYSIEFFCSLREHLTPDGVLVTHAGPVGPGADAHTHRAGLTWIQHATRAAGFSEGCAYHTFLPSFQSEWGFWMSCAPAVYPHFPEEVRILSGKAQVYACTWPEYWGM